MTALKVTDAEPLGDIAAQLRCLVDPAHVKLAVWVSALQVAPEAPAAWCKRLELAAGVLFACPRDIAELAADPSEETLGRILGYVECKGAACEGNADLPVVQALDADGWVVWEQLASWSRVGAARAAAADYGRVRVVSMAECLARRARLIAAEAACEQVPSMVSRRRLGGD